MAKTTTEKDKTSLEDNEENGTEAVDSDSVHEETSAEVDEQATKTKPEPRKRGRPAGATGNGVKKASSRAAKNKINYEEAGSESEDEKTSGGKAKKPINGKPRKHDDDDEDDDEDGPAKAKRGRGRPKGSTGEKKVKAKTGSGKPRGRPKKV